VVGIAPFKRGKKTSVGQASEYAILLRRKLLTVGGKALDKSDSGKLKEVV
jgi:hypothetical protein